jgi:hypothetical protein
VELAVGSTAGTCQSMGIDTSSTPFTAGAGGWAVMNGNVLTLTSVVVYRTAFVARREGAVCMKGEMQMLLCRNCFTLRLGCERERERERTRRGASRGTFTTTTTATATIINAATTAAPTGEGQIKYCSEGSRAVPARPSGKSSLDTR